MRIWVFVSLLVIFICGIEVQAEPWMSNRFAQNCAACHAPGRLNRKPSKRRCTLSCQGCHVNPNGGGLRNSYGKWNSERWARSFYTKLAWNRHSPAPLKKQHYAQKDLKPKKKKKFAKHGAKLVGFPGVVKNEKLYFESSNYTAAENLTDELSRMTRNDPYRIERRTPIQAGGDLRLFYIKQNEDAPSATDALKAGSFWPMVFDYAVRVRPIRSKLSLVYEGRAFNSNASYPSSIDNLFGSQTGGATTRSAYVLVDDLWYNSYVQAGYFRPMFGNYNPNHAAMIYRYTDLGQFARVKAIGFGSAPNVPFGIVNVIMPIEGASSNDIGRGSGFHATLGMRFVRYGASLVGSYWDTSTEGDAVLHKRTMYNIAAGGVLGRFILNGEFTTAREQVDAQLDESTIWGVDAKYRFWREMYLQANVAYANAAIGATPTGVSPGSGSEIGFGVKAFVISGLELEAMYTSWTNSVSGQTDTKTDTMQFQIHAYF